jgi:hypothetical protein
MRCPKCKTGIIYQRSDDFVTIQGPIPITGCYLCGYLAIKPYLPGKEQITNENLDTINHLCSLD